MAVQITSGAICACPKSLRVPCASTYPRGDMCQGHGLVRGGNKGKKRKENGSGRKIGNVLHRVMYPKMHANGCQKKKKCQGHPWKTGIVEPLSQRENERENIPIKICCCCRLTSGKLLQRRKRQPTLLNAGCKSGNKPALKSRRRLSWAPITFSAASSPTFSASCQHSRPHRGLEYLLPGWVVGHAKSCGGLSRESPRS